MNFYRILSSSVCEMCQYVQCLLNLNTALACARYAELQSAQGTVLQACVCNAAYIAVIPPMVDSYSRTGYLFQLFSR
jgi:hypothetical protein